MVNKIKTDELRLSGFEVTRKKNLLQEIWWQWTDNITIFATVE